MKKTFEHENISKKTSIQLNEVTELPYEILELLNNLINNVVRESNKKKQEKNMNNLLVKFQEIQSRLYAYGSLDSIKILSKLQETNYAIEKQELEDNNCVIAMYILLVSQLKYDITGEIISPEYWFKMTFKNYEDYKLEYKRITNDLVEELNLNKKFNF